jgi:RNA polymerase sigma-70 factor (ECF subfamily)
VFVVADSDAVLLEAWRGGDANAGDALFSRHFSAVFRFFRNKVDEAAAEDLTQATFLACVDGRDRFRGDASFRTYLFAVARNQLLMHFRSRARAGVTVEPTTTSAADFGPGPVSVAIARAEQRLLLLALRGLSLDAQIALELYYWEGIAGDDLAEILGVPVATARSRILRAREQLAEHIDRLAESPELRASTAGGIEDWARSLRELIVGALPDTDV